MRDITDIILFDLLRNHPLKRRAFLGSDSANERTRMFLDDMNTQRVLDRFIGTPVRRTSVPFTGDNP